VAYLDVLQLAHAITVLRPYHGGSASELTHQPKIYAFDTGFVAWAHGWADLRPSERGLLWEHLVLDTLAVRGDRVHFWRDNRQNEVDFVVARGRGACDAFECKWSPEAFDPRGLRALRTLHPDGRNYLVCPIAGQPYDRAWGELVVRVVSAVQLPAEVGG
jgi:predicted AAA+ superfamily ATPase